MMCNDKDISQEQARLNAFLFVREEMDEATQDSYLKHLASCEYCRNQVDIAMDFIQGSRIHFKYKEFEQAYEAKDWNLVIELAAVLIGMGYDENVYLIREKLDYAIKQGLEVLVDGDKFDYTFVDGLITIENIRFGFDLTIKLFDTVICEERIERRYIEKEDEFLKAASPEGIKHKIDTVNAVILCSPETVSIGLKF